MTPSRVLSVLQRALYPPIRVVSESTFALNSFGDNLQDKCSWLGLRPHWSIGEMENMFRSQFNVASIEQINITQKLVLEQAQFWLQFKNMSNTRADVTVYKLYPRMDIPSGFSGFTGINPTGLQEWFADAVNATPTNPVTNDPNPGDLLWPNLRRQAYNEHDADITTAGSSRFFRIKKVMRKFLEPGQFVILKSADRKPKIITKQKYGLAAEQTFQDQWDYFKSFGPILLFRVQGSATHNKTLATAPATNKLLDSTMSSYNVEFYTRYMKQTRQHISAITAQATISARLPTFAVANEKGVEIRQAQVANMDIGG